MRLNATRHHAIRAFAGAALLAAVWASPAGAQKFDFTVFHPERNVWTETLKWWFAEVEKGTSGRVSFTPHYSGSLVNINETLKAIRDGAVPAGYVAAGAVSGQIPSFAYMEAMGGMPEGPDQFVESLEKLRPVLEAEFLKQNVEFLWGQPSPGLNVMCRDKHMKTIADWKGKKVRTAGRWQARQIAQLGASPVSMDPAEQYIALQNKTIDCALSVHVLAFSLKLHEVAPYVTELRMPVNLGMYIMNKGTWDKLSADDRAKIKSVGSEAVKRAAPYVNSQQTAALDQMKAQKAQAYTLSDKDLEDFRKAIRPVFDEMDGPGGDGGKQIKAILTKYW
jgi:TRAP-type C4-dicarboxylate transport system substrate-binding protein